jgi:hypothetical protein
MGNIEHRYGIAAKAAGEAALRYGHYGAKVRPITDAFLLSRIARAVVDALDADDRGAVKERDDLLRDALRHLRSDVRTAREIVAQRIEAYLDRVGGQ